MPVQLGYGFIRWFHRPAVRTLCTTESLKQELLDWGLRDLVVWSRTDTFGLVMLEALACGTPVAAFPVTGPRDVVQQGVTGWLDEDLDVAVRKALGVRREDCRKFAVANGWPKIAGTLAANLASIDWQRS